LRGYGLVDTELGEHLGDVNPALPALGGIGIHDGFRRQHRGLERSDVVDVRLWRAGAHGNADAHLAESVDARAGDRTGFRQRGESASGADDHVALGASGDALGDVAGGAEFEAYGVAALRLILPGELTYDALHRTRAEHDELGGACRAGRDEDQQGGDRDLLHLRFPSPARMRAELAHDLALTGNERLAQRIARPREIDPDLRLHRTWMRREHQQHLRIVGERTRNGDALLHAAGQLMRIDVGELLQADHAQEFERGGLAL